MTKKSYDMHRTSEVANGSFENPAYAGKVDDTGNGVAGQSSAPEGEASSEKKGKGKKNGKEKEEKPAAVGVGEMVCIVHDVC